MPTVARSLLALCLSIPWAGALAACPGTQVKGAQTAPVAELSGLAIVPGAPGELVAIGDHDWDVAFFAADGAAAATLRRARPDDGGKRSQYEAVAVDGAGRAWLLSEHPSRVEVWERAGDGLRRVARVALDVPAGHPLARDWAADDNARGEGMVLLEGGHLLVAKQKKPRALIEFGPEGAAPVGVRAAPTAPPTPEARDARYVPLAVWRLDAAGEAALGSLNDLAWGPGGGLYVVASKPAPRVARLRLPLDPGGGALAVDGAPWDVGHAELGKAEGLAFLPDGRAVVGFDADAGAPNVIVVAPPAP